MKKIVAKKILLITTLAMVIFASFSVVIINFLNMKMVGENLTRLFKVYSETVKNANGLAEVAQNIGEIPDSMRVTIITENGVVIADNVSSPNTMGNMSEDPSFKLAVNNTERTILVRSSYFRSEAVVYSAKLTNYSVHSGFLVLRVGMSLNYDSNYFVMMIPIILLVLAVVMLLTFLVMNTLISNAISPLGLMQQSLENINKGIYHQLEFKSKYRDVQKVIDEINRFSSKISNSVNYLSYEQKKSNLILENMSQGIIALSKNNNMVLTNRSTLQAFGTTKNLLGCKLNNLIEDSELLERINGAIERGKDAMFERQIGEKIYRFEIAKMRDDWMQGEKSIETLITLTDITQESQSATIRSEFFANASHELKTPLTAVKGFSELLPQMQDDQTKAKCAEEITKNTDRMLGLIDDMLKLSKMDANVVDEHAELLDLTEIVNGVVENVRAIAVKNGVSIQAEGFGKMYGIKKQIVEVVTNLVDNAIKYNKKDGNVDIKIYEKGKNVFLVVKDTGIGIDSIHQSRVFERFYRVDKGRNRKVQSTGLGLAIVKHIILQHNGKISLESKLGEGSTFYVSFPSAEGNEQ